jgi:hypothetical protein
MSIKDVARVPGCRTESNFLAKLVPDNRAFHSIVLSMRHSKVKKLKKKGLVLMISRM